MDFIKQVINEFIEDDCTSMAAALAYYTIFALAPLLVLIILAIGAVLDPSYVQTQFEAEARELIGPSAASQIKTMIENAQTSTEGGVLSSVLGILLLLFGATGIFAQLQYTLNRVWDVRPDPNQGGINNFLSKRLIAFGVVLAVAVLLFASLIVSTLIQSVGGAAADQLPDQYSHTLLAFLNLALSLIIVTFLFGLLFKYLPDAAISWKDVAVGAAFTAVLFEIGKWLISLYLSQTDTGSTFGAAGSLVVILVWIYYSSIILLLGAEFTQVWARFYGDRIQPRQGAVRVIRDTRTVPGQID